MCQSYIKYLLAVIVMATSTIRCSSSTAISGSNDINPANILITQIELDNNSAGFSMYVHFTNKTELSNWLIGFYQPFTYTTIAPWNPKLTMQICTEASFGNYINCEPLIYNQTTNGSAGYTTVVSVDSSSKYNTLAKNSKYVLVALNNSMGKPRNYSSYPQNFYSMVNNHVVNIATNINTYTVSDYDPAQIATENNQHIQNNWKNSLTNTSQVNIVPYPISYTAKSAKYTINDGIIIHNTLSTTNNISDFYQSTLLSDVKITSQTNKTSSNTGIIIEPITNPRLVESNPEGYTIDVTNTAIIIQALNDTGAFYALQTLRQLWNASLVIPGMHINDYPRFKYRGILLDSARHFQSISVIKNTLDMMALHKINTLHWHLGEDEAFRINLEAYPALTSIGSFRGFDYPIIPQVIKQANLDLISGFTEPQLYATAADTYNGTYNSIDIEDIIKYANARSIYVIAEIDTPGHARALRKSLPNAYVDPNDLSVYASIQGFNDNVIPICTYNTDISVGRSFTATTDQIFNQTASLFNSQTTLYAVNNEISVGADEVSSKAWTNDSSCQGDWMDMNALSKAQYFFKLFSRHNINLKLSGWQQLVQTDTAALGTNIVPAQNTAHIWVWNSAKAGTSQAISLADAGYPTVLDYSDQVYFDLTYNKNADELGQYWATDYSDTNAALSIATSSLDTVTATSTPKNILGVEGALWSENIVTQDDLNYMAFPKMAGVAEAGWSSSKVTTQNGAVSWQSLATRLGCGQTGFLATLYKLYGAKYRGYPNGIALEVPNFVCHSN